MIKAILKWVFGLIFMVTAGYYGVCKIFSWENAFTILIDKILGVIGVCLNFIAHHIVAILIVVALGFVLWGIYHYIVTHHDKNF